MYTCLRMVMLASAILGGQAVFQTTAADRNVPGTKSAEAGRTSSLRDLDEKHHAVIQAERTGDPSALHKALRSLAEAELHLGLYTEYLGSTLKILNITREMQDVSALAAGLRDLSFAYELNLQPDRAIEEARNALAMVLPTKDDKAILSAQIFLMERMIHGDKPAEALILGEKALDRARNASDILSVTQIHMIIAELRISQGAHGEALSHLALAEGVIMDRGAQADRQRFLLNMARAQIGMERSKPAKELLDQVADLLAVHEVADHRTKLIEARYDLAVLDRKWELAVKHLDALRTRTDSIAKAQVALQMAGLQVRYDLERKQQDNDRLRELNTKHAETITDQLEDRRVLLALLACMVALASGLFMSARYSFKMMRRMRMKNAVIRQQSDEIHAKNLQLEQQNRRLADALLSEEEKELTIKEIHHRVKNNLQVVDSLLSIQGGDQGDPAVVRLFKEAQGRIRSMALVHEHIYRAGGMTEGTLRNHITQLARSVLTAYGMHDRISVQVDSDEPMFHVDTMMPLTLLINELLTNAVKHAFDGKDNGRIQIKVRRVGKGHELLFTDNGVGLDNAHYLKKDSFGLELVHLLAEQLNGEVRIIHDNGATFCLNFSTERSMVRLAS